MNKKNAVIAIIICAIIIGIISVLMNTNSSPSVSTGKNEQTNSSSQQATNQTSAPVGKHIVIGINENLRGSEKTG